MFSVGMGECSLFCVAMGIYLVGLGGVVRWRLVIGLSRRVLSSQERHELTGPVRSFSPPRVTITAGRAGNKLVGKRGGRGISRADDPPNERPAECLFGSTSIRLYKYGIHLTPGLAEVRSTPRS